MTTAPDPPEEPPAALRPLLATPFRFELFTALRLLEAASPAMPRLGEARRGRDEVWRLGQPPHLHFAPASLAHVSAPRHDRPGRLTTYAFGLFGPQGPLPLHVTRHAYMRARGEQDPTLARFCDVFHHRLLSLYWRGHAKARPVVEHDRPASDRFAARVGALTGLATPSFAARSALPDRFTLFTAGLFAMQSRPPEAVVRLVSLFFQIPVRLQEFMGAWLDIPLEARTRLGLADGASCLAADAVIGTRTFARHHRFRLVLGPLTLKAYLRFLPVGDALPKLRALLRHAAGLELDWDTQLVLRREEVPPAALDGRVRLGWTSWLVVGQRTADAGDLVLLGSR